VDLAATAGDSTPPTARIRCLTEAEIFRDRGPEETAAIAAVAPMKTYAPGETLYSPDSPVEALFILKGGRVRIFRVASDGRALTTAVMEPGAIFGEMGMIGQRMHDNFAEALDAATVCLMSRVDVHRFLLSDPRIAARITETLGSRLAELERGLADTVSKTVPQRIASALATLAREHIRYGRPWPRPFTRARQVTLTPDQLAALVGTSPETAAEILGEYASRGLIRLAAGRITVPDPAALRREAGEG
jgi:CRP/FNR family transcriptional regulator, cyclic AMP receptor protein